MVRKSLVFLVFLILSCLPWTVSASGDDDWIYCRLTDSIHSKVYFSNVFLGDYSWSIRYENAFTDYVHAEYDDVIGVASCFFEKDQNRARAALYDQKASAKRIYDDLIQTVWTY